MPIYRRDSGTRDHSAPFAPRSCTHDPKVLAASPAGWRIGSSRSVISVPGPRDHPEWRGKRWAPDPRHPAPCCSCSAPHSGGFAVSGVVESGYGRDLIESGQNWRAQTSERRRSPAGLEEREPAQRVRASLSSGARQAAFVRLLLCRDPPGPPLVPTASSANLS
jgi:hypothetical protein